ncbi:MAG: CAP domain-containing protein [Flavobacteriales bacterium]
MTASKIIPQFILTGLLVILQGQVSVLEAQEWTSQEIASADLARDLSTWSEMEKDVLLHTNLVRLYPQKYLAVVVLSWDRPEPWASIDKSTKYYKGLVQELKTAQPLPALHPSEYLHDLASCFAEAQGKRGDIGHNRSGSGCRDVEIRGAGMSAENCSYGMQTGMDVVMQLLIDEDVKSLGHRKNIFNDRVHYLGVGQAKHTEYYFVTVQDFCTNQ